MYLRNPNDDCLSINSPRTQAKIRTDFRGVDLDCVGNARASNISAQVLKHGPQRLIVAKLVSKHASTTSKSMKTALVLRRYLENADVNRTVTGVFQRL